MYKKNFLRDLIIEHLNLNGGHLHLKDLYAFLQQDKRLEMERWKSLVSFEASVRATLERFSSDSQRFAGKEDLFYAVRGKGLGEWGVRNVNLLHRNLDLTCDDEGFPEGKKILISHIKRERNHYVTLQAKKLFKNRHQRLYCEICGFDFEKIYGPIGQNFIEAHHIVPLSSLEKEQYTKPEDFVMLCSNCHAMIHRRRPWLTKEDLKSLLSIKEI